MAGKTSNTVAVSHIPTYINQIGNFNINSETETVQDMMDRNYNSGSVLKEDDVFHIKQEHNPILIIHNSSKGELNQSRSNLILRKSQQANKIK